METLQNLIEEFKLRTLWFILSVFTLTYFLTHTSKSMLLNIPISILFVAMLRILLNEVEFGWKVRNSKSLSYFSHLGKKQFDNDFSIGNVASGVKWKRKIDSPVVDAAVEDFVDQILRDFVVDLWYSDITPDREAPKLIRDLIMDVLGEVCGRVKEINIVELLTKDIVDLIGNHLELFRRNQSDIGLDVMETLSCEERDERLKHHLLSSKELHPALISSDCEYKVLQRLMGGVLAVVLRQREAQSPLVRCIARELLTCLVMQPVMNFATPEYINELIEYIILAYQNEGSKDFATEQSPNMENHNHGNTVSEEHLQSGESNLKNNSSNKQQTDLFLLQSEHAKDEPVHTRYADRAKVIDAAYQRRSEVLMPEYLENMWTGGRNYQKKLEKRAKQNKAPTHLPLLSQQDICSTSINIDSLKIMEDYSKEAKGELEAAAVPHESRHTLKKSNSTSDLKAWINRENGKGTTSIINEYYSADIKKLNADKPKSSSDVVIRSEGLHTPRLRCRVLGAYFEKLGSQSFAVYSIAVTDADNKTCFVKRRYRNFERLHRHLKDIPNYTLHLPPKRIFSSSTEDAFVHQRCILLDKYLQDLLSIANVAEQHEVWDFLSDSSKNYSFGKSTSVMRSLAVNVDDAMDDIVRQFKGVSDSPVQLVAGPPSSYHEPGPPVMSKNLWAADDINKLVMSQTSCESSGTEDGDIHHVQKQVLTGVGWRSDGELDSEGHQTKAKGSENAKNRGNKEIQSSGDKTESTSRYPKSALSVTGVPPEWMPPNMSVPVLNLVDNIFQLKRRGWLRRQVFWISKQILQLVMEDAIDDWLLRQIQWLRREDIIAQGIRWVKDVLWPDGTFFRRLRIQDAIDNFQSDQHPHQTAAQPGEGVIQPGSFEQQLEAARRASDVKKIIFNGAPATLVSLIGQKHYRNCARDIYDFLQSTVCLKQLGYAMLELVLLSIFPELRDLVMDTHEKTQPE